MPELRGGTAHLLFEQAAEIAGIAEAAGFHDLADGHIRTGQVFFGGGSVEVVSGCIMQGAAVISYIVAEGWADAAHAE